MKKKKQKKFKRRKEERERERERKRESVTEFSLRRYSKSETEVAHVVLCFGERQTERERERERDGAYERERGYTLYLYGPRKNRVGRPPTEHGSPTASENGIANAREAKPGTCDGNNDRVIEKNRFSLSISPPLTP